MSVFALHFPWQLLRFIVRHDNRWCFSVFSEVMFVVVFYIEESENSEVKSSPLGQLFSNTSLHVLFLQNPVGLSRALREKKHKIVTSNILYGYFEKSSTFSRNFAGIAENPRYLPETIIKHACKPWFQVREDSKPLAGVLSRGPLGPGGRYYYNIGSRKREEQLNFWKEGRRYCAWGLMGNDVSVVFFSFLLG